MHWKCHELDFNPLHHHVPSCQVHKATRIRPRAFFIHRKKKVWRWFERLSCSVTGLIALLTTEPEYREKTTRTEQKVKIEKAAVQ